MRSSSARRTPCGFSTIKREPAICARFAGEKVGEGWGEGWGTRRGHRQPPKNGPGGVTGGATPKKTYPPWGSTSQVPLGGRGPALPPRRGAELAPLRPFGLAGPSGGRGGGGRSAADGRGGRALGGG